MRKFTLAFVAALALATVPAAAFASKPTNPGKSGTHSSTNSSTHSKNPTVTYIVKGVVVTFTAPTSTGVQPTGSITVVVTRVNHRLTKTLKGMTLTFGVSYFTKHPRSGTRIVEHKHQTITNCDRVLIRLRAPRKIDGDPATVLQAAPVKMIVGKRALKNSQNCPTAP